jgi:hypothetical protein
MSARAEGPLPHAGCDEGALQHTGRDEGALQGIGRRPARELTNSIVERPQGHLGTSPSSRTRLSRRRTLRVRAGRCAPGARETGLEEMPDASS